MPSRELKMTDPPEPLELRHATLESEEDVATDGLNAPTPMSVLEGASTHPLPASLVPLSPPGNTLERIAGLDLQIQRLEFQVLGISRMVAGIRSELERGLWHMFMENLQRDLDAKRAELQELKGSRHVETDAR